jgi:uncharacterized RDD family membrane protein YckC
MWPFRNKDKAATNRAAIKRARKLSDGLEKRLQIIPPEGVPLNIRLAPLGQRLGAQVVDTLVTFIGAMLFVLLFSISFWSSWNLIAIVAALTFFLVRIPYYIVSELVWNGRTLAKRWLGLRVVSVDGRSLSAHQIVVRNIMKEIEFFLPLTYALAGPQQHWSFSVIAWGWLLVLLIVPWRNKHNKRIGDIIANTAVIMDPKPVLLTDLASTIAMKPGTLADERFVFSSAQLDEYGRYELQVLEKVLRSSEKSTSGTWSKQQQYLKEIVERIVQKIDYEETIDAKDHRLFLEAFYTAQREHLERRKLLGDAREDKYFRDEKGEES